MTPLDEGSSRRRDLYQTTPITKETDILTLAGFESTIPKCEWPQTQVLDRAATAIGHVCLRGAYFVALLYAKQVTFLGRSEIWA